MSPPTTANAPWHAMDGLGEHHLSRAAAAPPNGRRTPCPSGQAPPGTSCATCDPHNNDALASQGGAGLLDARWTGTTAAWSTPRCTCSTAGSGTSSCTTSAWCPPGSRIQKRTSHGMILGENGEKMSKIPRQRGQPGRHRARTTARTPCACMRCSSAILRRARPWNTASIKGCRRFLERVLEPGG